MKVKRGGSSSSPVANCKMQPRVIEPRLPPSTFSHILCECSINIIFILSCIYSFLRERWFEKKNQLFSEELVAIIWVIVKKSSPKNLSADSRPTVGQQTANCRPTAADSRPTDGRQSADSRPTGFLGSSSSQLPK